MANVWTKEHATYLENEIKRNRFELDAAEPGSAWHDVCTQLLRALINLRRPNGSVL